MKLFAVSVNVDIYLQLILLKESEYYTPGLLRRNHMLLGGVGVVILSGDSDSNFRLVTCRLYPDLLFELFKKTSRRKHDGRFRKQNHFFASN